MAAHPIPDTFTAVTPYLIVRDVDKVLEFVSKAFGATEVDVNRDDSGRVMHADVTIGGAHIMMGQTDGTWPERLGSIHLYLPDADAAYQAALAAGATSIYEVTNQFYGDRSGGVEDPSGIAWWISTHVEDVPPDEMERRMRARKG